MKKVILFFAVAAFFAACAPKPAQKVEESVDPVSVEEVTVEEVVADSVVAEVPAAQ